jgi:phosphoglycolate phosphatase
LDLIAIPAAAGQSAPKARQGMGGMIKGLVFDKDGTLFDFRRSWGGWADGFLRQIADNGDHARVLGQSIGFNLDTGSFQADSPVIAATAADIALALSTHLPGQSLASITSHINAAAAMTVMVEAVPLQPLLSTFRARGLKIGLATNDTEIPARAHLAAHGITGYFDFIAGYDSGHGPKPGPGMCLAFAHSVGLDPANCAMVGDSLHDLEAGRAAGMVCIGVLTGIAEAETLAPHCAVVLPDIGAIPAWLDQQA